MAIKGRLPFGHKLVDGVATPIKEEVEALAEAQRMVLEEELSLNAAGKWLSEQVGRSVSPNTIRRTMTPVQQARLRGQLTPGQKRAKTAREAKARKAATAKRQAQRKREKKAERKEIRQQTNKVERLVSVNKNSKAGKIIETKELEEMNPKVQEQVEENIIFKPNEGPQEEFLAAPETDVLYGGAAGGGKSYAMIIDPLRFCHRAAHRALVLRKTMPELRELIDKSRELYPKAFPGAKFREVDKVWKFPSGASVQFGFLEKDADVYRYQGQAYSWIGFDEITHLATEFPWQYLSSRLRTTDPEITCYLRCTANPGGIGHHWVKKRYVDPAEWGESFVGKDGLTRKFIPAKLSDNPYLAEDGRYEQMLESLDEVTRRRLLEGDWFINDGAAFPEFSRELHVIEPFQIPTHWRRFKGVDYGYTSPSASLWCAIDPNDGTILVYRELYAKGLTGEDLAKTMLDLEMEDPGSVPGVLDTAAWNRTGYTGPTIGETLNRAGLKLRPADKNRIAGKIQIHERLKKNPDTGRPKLQIFSTCKNLIQELETLPMDKNNSEDVDTHAADHAYDALRYAVMSRPRQQSTFDSFGQIKQDVMYRPADNVFGY